jgi:hypothetical protein
MLNMLSSKKDDRRETISRAFESLNREQVAGWGTMVEKSESDVKKAKDM